MLIRVTLLILILFAGCTCKTDETLSVCFTGDLLLDRGVRDQIEKRGTDFLFNDVSELFNSADAVIANLECPVTNHTAPINKRFIFRGEPGWLPSLKRSGITHLVMANNHSNDQGTEGMEDTYSELLRNDLIPIGFGKDHLSACKPIIIEKKGIRLAVFSSAQLIMENFPFLPDKSCICQASTEELVSAILKYKKKNPKDYVIVVLHWGAEYQTIPSPIQRIKAKKLINAGCDAIIGHHPHVIQPMGYIDNKPVFYSLGNFIFDSTKPNTNTGLMVQFEITKKKITFIEHKIKITNCRPELIEFSSKK